ncbi:unnamed protein product [Porites lobata]|uniref:Uncharacterized protein n=1 Tax=Porites lobata TaxID=104759 RepID=A0ABN8P533_9CNID|nr:unnamed protein product [Porites lobata]
MTKSRLWKSYQGACAANGHESIGYSKFCDCGANFAFSLPASDLCWTSQKNKNQTLKSANLPDVQKAEVVRQQENHLRLALGERDFYKNWCKTTKDTPTEHLRNVEFSEKRAPSSRDPANPFQAELVYFKTPL